MENENYKLLGGGKAAINVSSSRTVIIDALSEETTLVDFVQKMPELSPEEFKQFWAVIRVVLSGKRQGAASAIDDVGSSASFGGDFKDGAFFRNSSKNKTTTAFFEDDFEEGVVGNVSTEISEDSSESDTSPGRVGRPKRRSTSPKRRSTSSASFRDDFEDIR